MKKAYIIHKWGGSPKSDWYPWLKKELESRDFRVFIPKMPHPDEPIIKERISFLQKSISEIDEETIFIGHSIGCQEILRFIETLPPNKKIKKLIFIAGWFNLDNLEDEETSNLAKPWTTTPIDFEKINKIAPNVTVFLSTNETYGFVKENSKIFKEKLNARVILLKNKGHFTEEEGVTEIPEMLNEI